MEQRLTTIDRNTHPQYVQGSPLILEACALYMDNVDGQCIAQIKLKNIDDRPVVAVMVELVCFDIFQHEITRRVFEYAEIHANKGRSFGTRKAIPLKSDRVKKYQVYLKIVKFGDGEVKEYASLKAFHPLPDAKPVEIQGELLEQYKRELIKAGLGTKVVNQMQTADGLWQCVCGSWQKEGDICVSCHAVQEKLREWADLDVLREHVNACVDDRKDHILLEAKKKLEGNGINAYNDSLRMLESIAGWKNADELIKECQKKIVLTIRTQEELQRMQMRRKAEEKRSKIIRIVAIIAVIVIAAVFMAVGLTK